MPQNVHRCEAEWNPGLWPYVKRCDSTSKWVGTREGTNAERMEVCDEHLPLLNPLKPVLPA